MSTLKHFEVRAMSDEDYEELIVEVTYRGEHLLLVSQERGLARMRLAIYPRADAAPWDFSMKEFEAMLQMAVEKLRALHRDGG